MIAPIAVAIAAGVAMTSLSAPLKALVVLPAVLVAPGWGFAGLMRGGDRLTTRLVNATWISIAGSVPAVSIARLTGGGGGAILAFALLLSAVGWWLSREAPSPKLPSRGPALALATLVLSVLLSAATWEKLDHELERWWYEESANEQWWPEFDLEAASGWASEEAIDLEEWNDSDSGALLLKLHEGSSGTLEAKSEGRLFLAIQGSVGGTVTVTVDGSSEEIEILADVVEVEEEGAVPRYLDRGSLGLGLDLAPGHLSIRAEGAGEQVTVIAMPGSKALWAANDAGEINFAHYYQILNIVENQRWAAEVLESRNLTVHQPPLWSYVLAVPVALVDVDVPGANLLFLFVLLLIGVTAVELIEETGVRRGVLPWVLPGLYCAVHFKLMSVPSSTNFPDSLYAAAILGGASSIVAYRRGGSPWRVALFGLAAGSLRYPGVVVITIAIIAAALIGRVRAKGTLVRLYGIMAGVAVVALAAGAISGLLDEWLFALYFETGPEHYHGDYSIASLLPRPPEFYGQFLRYMGFWAKGVVGVYGGAALFAGLTFWAIRASGPRSPSRWLLLTALTYSLLLCTIDHFPTHYFLPLVHLVGAAFAIAALSNRAGRAGDGAAGLAAVAAIAFIIFGVA